MRELPFKINGFKAMHMSDGVHRRFDLRVPFASFILMMLAFGVRLVNQPGWSPEVMSSSPIVSLLQGVGLLATISLAMLLVIWIPYLILNRAFSRDWPTAMSPQLIAMNSFLPITYALIYVLNIGDPTQLSMPAMVGIAFVHFVLTLIGFRLFFRRRNRQLSRMLVYSTISSVVAMLSPVVLLLGAVSTYDTVAQLFHIATRAS